MISPRIARRSRIVPDATSAITRRPCWLPTRRRESGSHWGAVHGPRFLYVRVRERIDPTCCLPRRQSANPHQATSQPRRTRHVFRFSGSGGNSSKWLRQVAERRTMNIAQAVMSAATTSRTVRRRHRIVALPARIGQLTQSAAVAIDRPELVIAIAVRSRTAAARPSADHCGASITRLIAGAGSSGHCRQRPSRRGLPASGTTSAARLRGHQARRRATWKSRGPESSGIAIAPDDSARLRVEPRPATRLFVTISVANVPTLPSADRLKWRT